MIKASFKIRSSNLNKPPLKIPVDFREAGLRFELVLLLLTVFIALKIQNYIVFVFREGHSQKS
jgi:hypothetical protein